MLLEFTIENFRSINKEVNFNMTANADNEHIKDNLLKIKEDKVLKTAVISGANASGKTNFLKSLSFLKALILNSASHQKGTGIRFEPFKLDKKSLVDSIKMNLVFIQDSIKHVYGVEYNKTRVLTEYLHVYNSSKPTVIFERYFDKPDEPQCVKIEDYHYYFPNVTAKQKRIANDTNENTLYLSKTRTENFSETDSTYAWFNNLTLIEPNALSEDFTINLSNKSPYYKKLILKALNRADFGIDDFKGEIKEISMEQLPEDIKKMIPATSITGAPDKMKQIKLDIFHKGVPFPITEESEGTKKMFNLIGPIIDILEKGKVLLIDELDTKLHFDLLKLIVELFNSEENNPKGAQLIFTTHNTSILDLNIFRRDQIWFVEKNNDTFNTDLYSLIEFKERKDKNVERGYLAGKYGAKPFILKGKLFDETKETK